MCDHATDTQKTGSLKQEIQNESLDVDLGRKLKNLQAVGRHQRFGLKNTLEKIQFSLMQGKVAVEIDESRLEWWGRGVGHRGTFTSWAIVIVEEKGGKNKTMKEK